MTVTFSASLLNVISSVLSSFMCLRWWFSITRSYKHQVSFLANNRQKECTLLWFTQKIECCRHKSHTCSLLAPRSWLDAADSFHQGFLVAVRWKQTLPLIRKSVSSSEVTLFSLTGEEAWHMDTKLRYLVHVCGCSDVIQFVCGCLSD